MDILDGATVYQPEDLNSFKFKPLSSEEITAVKNARLLPIGKYKFTIKNIIQKFSPKSKSFMLEISMEINHDEKTYPVKDWIFENERSMEKLNNFCACVGLSDHYERGDLRLNEFLNKTGTANIGIRKGGAKPDGSGNFDDSNSVKDYLPMTLNEPTSEEFLNDKIPF